MGIRTNGRMCWMASMIVCLAVPGMIESLEMKAMIWSLEKLITTTYMVEKAVTR